MYISLSISNILSIFQNKIHFPPTSIPGSFFFYDQVIIICWFAIYISIHVICQLKKHVHVANLVLWTFLSHMNVFFIYRYPGIYIVYHTSDVSAQWCYDRLIYKKFSILIQVLAIFIWHGNSYMYLEKKNEHHILWIYWLFHLLNYLFHLAVFVIFIIFSPEIVCMSCIYMYIESSFIFIKIKM